MSLAMAIFTYLNAWFISLFFVLPFGVKRDEQAGARDYAAAPAPMKWRKLFIINSFVGLGFTLAIYWLVGSGLISVRKW